jgi:hypothetical protein
MIVQINQNINFPFLILLISLLLWKNILGTKYIAISKLLHIHLPGGVTHVVSLENKLSSSEDMLVIHILFLDSTYMNDVWSFNTLTMDWNEIETTG